MAARQVYNNFFIGDQSELTGTTMNSGCVFLAEDTQEFYGVDISGDTFFISSVAITDTSQIINSGETGVRKYDEVITSTVIVGDDVDWESDKHQTLTLTGNTTLTFSNIVLYKVVTLEITGNFTLTLPATIPTSEYEDYDGTEINLIHMYCIDDTGAAEKFDIVHAIIT